MLLVKFCLVFPIGTSLSHLLCGGCVGGEYFGIFSKRRIIYLDKRRCSQWGSSSVLRGLRDWYASKTTPSGVRPQYLEVFAQRHSPSHHIGIKFCVLATSNRYVFECAIHTYAPLLCCFAGALQPDAKRLVNTTSQLETITNVCIIYQSWNFKSSLSPPQ